MPTLESLWVCGVGGRELSLGGGDSTTLSGPWAAGHMISQ